MMPRPLRIIFALLMLAIFVPGPIVGQAPQVNTLSGTVHDPTSAVISGAEVSVKNLATMLVMQKVTDAAGKFSFTAIANGRYELTIRQAGFAQLVQEVTLTPGEAFDRSFQLTLAAAAESLNVEASLSALPTESPTAEVVMSVGEEEFRNTPAATVSDIFDLIPGVTTLQANGPRDISVSVRGSNERQTFGVRNIQMAEDGFPITQPDGLGRTDLSDPHAYSGVDVVEGPSSALYGNYATDGSINFHTRQAEGIELGTDYGSFNYFNDYLSMGASGQRYRVSAMLSNAGGSQYTDHTKYHTLTANILGAISLTDKDRFTFKFVDNELITQLSIRLSLNQFISNPWQQGCSALANVACASVSLFGNGYNGTKVAQSPEQAGLGRHDRRTITGGRWEHNITDNTLWTTQVVWDVRDISQPTSATSAIGPYPSFNVVSSLVRHGSLLGSNSTSFIAASYNYENYKSLTYNLVPGGNATLGGLTQSVIGSHWNGGFRARQELSLGRKWIVAAGFGGERTSLNATENIYSYPTGAVPTTTYVTANNGYFNVSPEASIRYQATSKFALHSHTGTGYGTPQGSNLFVTPAGVFGNNTQLKSQTNVGTDLGLEWNQGAAFRLSAAGFYEWFHNELVTQSPGVNLQSYTFNAPASAHRGVEAVAEIRPLYSVLSGLRLRGSYLLDRQTYTDYTETITSGNFSKSFVRTGNRIPGVMPNFLNARVTYDQATGRLQGLGGFVEEDVRQAFYLDNANIIQAPGSNTVNFNLRYNPPEYRGALSRLSFYFEVKNAMSKSYVGSAGNITDSLNTATGVENGIATLATSGSIWAGPPRSLFGGLRIRLLR